MENNRLHIQMSAILRASCVHGQQDYMIIDYYLLGFFSPHH